jgi:hypothetical protein
MLKTDMTLKGVKGEKIIAITSLDVRFIPAPFGIINYAVYASEEALAANDPLETNSMDVTEFDKALGAASLAAAMAALKQARFPEAKES